MSNCSFSEPFRLNDSLSVTNSSSTARWILQLTQTKQIYTVTNVHFSYAKGVVLWKLNYEPKINIDLICIKILQPNIHVPFGGGEKKHGGYCASAKKYLQRISVP